MNNSDGIEYEQCSIEFELWGRANKAGRKYRLGKKRQGKAVRKRAGSKSGYVVVKRHCSDKIIIALLWFCVTTHIFLRWFCVTTQFFHEDFFGRHSKSVSKIPKNSMYGTFYSALYFHMTCLEFLSLSMRGAIFLIAFWSSISVNQTERIKVRSNELYYPLLLKIVVALVSHAIIAE